MSSTSPAVASAYDFQQFILTYLSGGLAGGKQRGVPFIINFLHELFAFVRVRVSSFIYLIICFAFRRVVNMNTFTTLCIIIFFCILIVVIFSLNIKWLNC
jgi:hypothetical protein